MRLFSRAKAAAALAEHIGPTWEKYEDKSLYRLWKKEHPGSTLTFEEWGILGKAGLL